MITAMDEIANVACLTPAFGPAWRRLARKVAIVCALRLHAAHGVLVERSREVSS
jgi:hypothetical protein